MKKLIKFFLVMFALVLAQQASAMECSSNPTQLEPNSLKYYHTQTGVWCTAPPQQGSDVQLVTRQPVILNRMPDGYGYRDCTAGESLQRDALTMLKGAVIGALIGDTGRAAGVGGGLGLLFSTTGSCRVAVPQGNVVNQGVQGGKSGQPATVTVPSNCSIDGKPTLQDMRGVTEEQCAAIAVAVGSKATTGSTGALVFSNEAAGSGACRLRSDGSARLKSNPSQVTAKGEVLAVDQVSPESGSTTVVPKNPNEDCTMWRHRVAEQIVWK